MKIIIKNLNVFDPACCEEIKALLLQQAQQLDKIMTTQTELTQQLLDLKAQLVKVADEVKAQVTALEEALTNAAAVTPEVETALADLKGTVQALDDLNPDTVVEEPQPEPF